MQTDTYVTTQQASRQRYSFLELFLFLTVEGPPGYLPACQSRANNWCQTVSSSATAKSFQSYPTLYDPIDSSLPGSSVPGILQARTLEWVAISFSNAWKWKVNVKSLSHVWLLTTPWPAAYQASPSMGVSRQEYWSGWPLGYSKTGWHTGPFCEHFSQAQALSPYNVCSCRN